MNRPNLRAVKPLSESRLLLSYSNGESRIFDANPYLDKGIFRELHDSRIFNAARISFDTIEWPNGADFCPDVLYDTSTPSMLGSRLGLPRSRCIARLISADALVAASYRDPWKLPYGIRG
jgi:hypothetical protein